MTRIAAPEPGPWVALLATTDRTCFVCGDAATAVWAPGELVGPGSCIAHQPEIERLMGGAGE